MADLLELATRVEALTGPDREVDVAILLALDPGHEVGRIMSSGRQGLDGEEGRAWELRDKVLLYEVRNPNGSCWANGGIPFRDYTASLDAAMRLVPSGLCWRTACFPPNSATANVNRGIAAVEGDIYVIAATPALALTAAALRARAHQQAASDGGAVRDHLLQSGRGEADRG